MKFQISSAAIVLMTGLALVGCNDTNSSSSTPHSGADTHHDHNHDEHDHDHTHDDTARTPDAYAGIRGEITQLPVAGDSSKDLQIHHEQIREFKTKDGTVNINTKGIAGMMSMEMPFPLGEGVSLDGFGVGDKVEFDFVVNWGENRPAWEITRIEKLPDDTEIDFTNVIEENIEDLKDTAGDMMDDHNHEGP